MVNAGVAATPTTGVLVRQLRAAGGIQISASHNPPQYNGLKLFSAEGRVIPAAAGEQVIARYRAATLANRRSAPQRNRKSVDRFDRPAHRSLVLATSIGSAFASENIPRAAGLPITDRAACLGRHCWNSLAVR